MAAGTALGASLPALARWTIVLAVLVGLAVVESAEARRLGGPSPLDEEPVTPPVMAG